MNQHRVKRWNVQLIGSLENIKKDFYNLQDIASFGKGYWKKIEDNEFFDCLFYFKNQHRMETVKKMFIKSLVGEMEPIKTEAAFVKCLSALQHENTLNHLPLEFGKFLSEKKQKEVNRQEAWNKCQNQQAKSVLSIVRHIKETGITSATNFIFNQEPEKILQIDTGIKIYQKLQSNEMQQKLIDQAKKVQWIDWQTKLFNLLGKEPHPRQIIVVVDPIGNTGKTFFCQNYRRLFPDTTVYLNNAKAKDLLHSAQQLLLDLMRSEKKSIAYGAIEQLKNGCFLSAKFDSRFVEGGISHVVLFTNFELNYKAMSEDRWLIFHLKKQDDSEFIHCSESTFV